MPRSPSRYEDALELCKLVSHYGYMGYRDKVNRLLSAFAQNAMDSAISQMKCVH